MARAKTELPDSTGVQKYSIESLRASCITLFGVSKSTFDGATYGVNGPISTDEAKKLIINFKKTKIGGLT